MKKARFVQYFVRKDESFANRILFWRDNERLIQQGGQPIDPAEETAAIETVTGGGTSLAFAVAKQLCTCQIGAQA